MPVYEYECRKDGVFETMRAMSDAARPAPCPDCGRDAARILSAPRLARMAASDVKARDRNERSRHEPRVVRSTPQQGRKPQPDGRPPLQRSPSPRPWVLEHH